MARLSLIGSLLALLLMPAPARAEVSWTWPLHGEVITPYRNGGDPYASGQHRGIDIAAAVGERVVAAAGGTVTFAGVAGSSGLTVAIRTADDRFETSYLHLSAASVKRGHSVRAGAAVGAVGTTGKRSAERPHLHFGVRDADTDHAYRDPLGLLPPPPAPRPAPEPPKGAPAPIRHAPVSRPAPAPRAAPHLGPRPAPGRAPRTAPAPRRGRHPSPLRRPAPAARHGAPAAARPGFALAPAPAPGSAPARVRRAGDAADRPLRDGQRAPAAGAPGAAPASAAVRAQGPPAVERSRRLVLKPASGGGLDVGWLAACIGLVLAATALGRPDSTRRAAGRGRRAIGALLRPLTGRG